MCTGSATLGDILHAVCGICGATDDPNLAAVSAMNAAMVNRGPDDEGTYVDEATGVALGARRLSIIDVAGGHQPVSNEDGTVWAVLNGEIYNHPRLQGLLRARGHTLRSHTDTEVLVHLYEEYGEALVHALEGMYAFAIWDTRRRRLLVARDRLGEKPLFYVAARGQLAFASELTPLLRCGRLRADLDPNVVDQFFVLGYVPAPAAIVHDAFQLPPAHLLRWDAGSGSHSIQRYWSPPLMTEKGKLDDELVAEEIRALLETSVASRLVSDVPIGVFLSGGLDSTLVAALAARASSSAVQTFTVGYNVGDVSEVEPARRTAACLSTDHQELILSEADVTASIPRLLGSLDQPLADQALAPLHAVSALARDTVTVAVGGEGADELFGGYPRYRWLARAERVEELLPERPARALASALTSVSGQARWRRLAEVLTPGAPLSRHLDWVTDGRRTERALVYGPRLRDFIEGEGALASLDARIIEANGDDPVTRFMRLDLEHWLPDDVLAKADRAGMLASLEIRTPFLQRELVEMAATLPASFHLRRGGKRVLHQILSEVAPEAAWSRPKTAFRVPAPDWLRGRLGDVLERQFDGARIYEDGWLSMAGVRAILDEHRLGRSNRSATLWPVLALATWYEGFASARVD